MNDEIARHPKPNVDSKAEIEQFIGNAVSAHEHALIRYACLLVGDLDRARDVVQDTFLRLYQKSQTHHEQKAIEPRLKKWLYKVCRNRAIDVCRKENRMKPVNTETLLSQPSAAHEPIIAIEKRETDDHVEQQITRLSNNQQEVLRLKFQGGLSYQEIADVTGLSRTNVGFLLHKAISKLRETV